MSANSGEHADPIVSRLRALGQESPDLKETVQVYEAMMLLLRDADLRVAPIPLTQGEARAQMAKGLPLLSGVGIELDGRAVLELMLELARALETSGEDSRRREHGRSVAARHIRRALEEKQIDVPALLPRIAAGERGAVTAMAEGLHLEPGMLWTLAQAALKPALRAVRRQLTPLVEGISWNKGTCFVCGAAATLGELRDNTLARHLRCGQCGADWQIPRLQCPYCGNEDHRTLGLLYAEGQREKSRVEVCDKCRGYLKVITCFNPTLPDMLPVEDLATLHLDYAARDRGYTRPEGNDPDTNG